MLLAALIAALGLQAPTPEAQAFLAAYELKQQGRHLESAAAFEALARDFPDSPRAGEALVEAGVGWFSVGRARQRLHRCPPPSVEAFETALERFGRVVVDRATDPLAGRAQYMLGSTRLFLGQLAEAETEYGLVLERHAKDAKYAPKALERRAFVRRHLLRPEGAIEDMQRYLKEHPKGAEADSVANYLRFAGMSGKPAPALSPGSWVQGPAVTLDALRGKVVALLFFARTCPECLEEIPFVLDVEKRFRDAGLSVVGVMQSAAGETDEARRAYLAGQGIGFPVFTDTGGTTRAYLGRNVPDVVLVDLAGNVRWHDHPANLHDSTLEALLAEEPAPR